MITISITFTCAASGKAGTVPAFSLFWMMVFAVAIDDDAKRHEKEQRRKREAHAQARRKPLRHAPRPF